MRCRCGYESIKLQLKQFENMHSIDFASTTMRAFGRRHYWCETWEWYVRREKCLWSALVLSATFQCDSICLTPNFSLIIALRLSRHWKTAKIRGNKVMSHLTLKLISQRMAKTCLEIFVSSHLLVHFPSFCFIFFILRIFTETTRLFSYFLSTQTATASSFRGLLAHCFRNEFSWRMKKKRREEKIGKHERSKKL